MCCFNNDIGCDSGSGKCAHKDYCNGISSKYIVEGLCSSTSFAELNKNLSIIIAFFSYCFALFQQKIWLSVCLFPFFDRSLPLGAFRCC